MTGRTGSDPVVDPVAAAPVARPLAGRVPGVALVGAAAVLVSLASLVLALVLTGSDPAPVPAGLPDAGVVPGWALRVDRLLMDLTAVLAVGCLVTGGVLLRTEGNGVLGAVALRAMRSAGRWASGFVLTATAGLVLTTSDLTGLPPSELTGAALGSVVLGTPPGRALLLAILLAAVVVVGARQARTVVGACLLLVVAVGVLLPVGAAGHAASARDHDVALQALAVHVCAAAVWVGGLAGIVLILRTSPGHLAWAAHRFSALALVAFVALGGSGVLVATTRLGTSMSAWTSGYGAVVAAKAAVLVALGIVGLWHRRRTLPRLSAGRSAAFLQLAAGELVLMGAATGLAAALSRTPVPPLPVPAEPAHGGGHSTLPAVIDPLSLVQLVTAWRVNAVLALALGVALAVYLSSVRTLTRRGERWPRARTAAFTAGVALGLVTTCSGLATYAPAMVSVQIAQLLLTFIPVPALLALGAPVTLWVRVRGTEEVLRSPVVRRLSDPFVGAVLSCALLLGLFRSSLFELSLSSSSAHLLVLLLAVTAGLLLFWPVLGVDPAPGARTRLETATSVAAVVGCLALLAVQLRYGDQLLAANWFLELRWSWVDPVEDQRTGGALAGAAAAALLLLSAVSLLRPRASVDSVPQR